MHGPLYYRNLDQCKTQALKDNKGNFDAVTEMSRLAREELHWWACLSKQGILGSGTTCKCLKLTAILGQEGLMHA